MECVLRYGSRTPPPDPGNSPEWRSPLFSRERATSAPPAVRVAWPLESAVGACSKCGELLLEASLSKKGDPSDNGIWVARLTHDRKVRGTTACRGSGDRPESVRTGSRKTRVAGSKLDCLKSNPDRNRRSPDATLTQRVVIMCPGSVGSPGLVRMMRYRGIHPGRRDEWTA